jgi:hypothetical protein
VIWRLLHLMVRLLPLARLRGFARDTGAAATVEFIMVVVPTFTLFMSAAESGILSFRHVMLERGVDIATRALRISSGSTPSHEDVRRMICDNALILPDCETALVLEMRRVSKTTWSVLGGDVVCADRKEEIQPDSGYLPGQPDDIMLLRACLKLSPVFPWTGLGLMLPKDNNGDYAAISTAAFVNEP